LYSYQLSESSDENYAEEGENQQPNYLHPEIKEWADQEYAASKQDNSTDEEGLKMDDLKQSIMEKDSQILKFRSKNENILRQYKEAQEELEQCHEQIARQASIIHEQSYKLDEANHKLNDVSHTHNQLMQKSKINVTSFQNELEQRDEEVFKLREHLNIKDDKIRTLSEELEQEKERIEELAKEVRYKEEEIVRYKHK